MFEKNKNAGLIVTILVAALLITAGLVFVGAKIGSGQGASVDNIEKAIEAYSQKMQQKAASQQQLQQQSDQASRDAAAKNLKKPDANDHVYGSKDAQVTLIDYSDYECPYCKLFYPAAKQLVDNSKGKVNLVYRQFPLDKHDPMATKESVASECVASISGNDAFWKFSDLVYVNTKSNGNGLNDNQIAQFASQAGTGAAAFDACIKSGKFDKLIKDSITEGDGAGVNGTPGDFLIDNKSGAVTVLDGALSLDELTTAVQQIFNPGQAN